MLHEITEGMWGLHDTVVMAGIHFPLRTVVVRLPDGSLWVHAPLDADEALFDEVEALGPVAHLIAPSGFHHLFVAQWQARFPAASTWITPSLVNKRADLAHTGVLTDEMSAPFDDVFARVTIDGVPATREVLFVHRATRTALVTDLLFNVTQPTTWWTRAALTMVGAFGRPAQSRAWRLWTKDRGAAGRSVERFLQEDFDRLVPSHGEIVMAGGKDVVRDQCAWMLAAA